MENSAFKKCVSHKTVTVGTSSRPARPFQGIFARVGHANALRRRGHRLDDRPHRRGVEGPLCKRHRTRAWARGGSLLDGGQTRRALAAGCPDGRRMLLGTSRRRTSPIRTTPTTSFSSGTYAWCCRQIKTHFELLFHITRTSENSAADRTTCLNTANLADLQTNGRHAPSLRIMYIT